MWHGPLDKNASCRGDSRFLKPEILVLEPLFCVDFSVCEADQENEEREEERDTPNPPWTVSPPRLRSV